MDLPDCPPGAEGYQDSVTEVPKKFDLDESTCTKAELEFQEHLNSLRIKLEDGTTQCMVERRGRDISGKWIYLCYPCAAVCSGESILQTHISGKKHKTKLTTKNVWPKSIFDEHPFIQSTTNKSHGATQKVLQKMAEEVHLHQSELTDLDMKYSRYRKMTCHIQETLDAVKAPLLGVEYLIEHPPEESHHEPSYICTLCSKQGHPRTIINHMTCFWHRHNYVSHHFQKACALLTPFRSQNKYREGVGVIMNRLAQRIVDKYGRMRPVNIDKEEYEREKERIHQWIFKGPHFSEKAGATFEEVVDVDLIGSLAKTGSDGQITHTGRIDKREPSPPVVPAPSRPQFNSFSRPPGRQERRVSADSLSDVSDEQPPRHREPAKSDSRSRTGSHKSRYEPYPERSREASPFRTKYAIRNVPPNDKARPSNYEYKLKLAEEKRLAAEESAKKTLAYHEKNPEKHPLYPEEWKRFWNRRYKEIQAEGKDPSKHDFKPEWIQFWTGRVKDLHEEELRIQVNEIYRRMCLSPPDMTRRRTTRSPPARRRSPDARRRSPDPRRRSPDARRDSPDYRRRSPPPRRRSPDHRRDHRSPERRHSPGRRRSPHTSRSLRTRTRTRSRSRSRSPGRRRGAAGAGERRRSRSPLSQRATQPRNRSPEHVAPSLQTVLISDDELRPDDGLSPWNSDEIDSMDSFPEVRSHASSAKSRSTRPRRDTRDSRDVRESRAPEPQELGPPENVVATLRLLVALEDYLGSLGPKIVDLLTEALKMEKEKANSSEELLERESALALLETAKERLKGAAQAGLLPAAAAAAARAAVVRAAATLHEADTRASKKQTSAAKKPAAVPVAGVGEVDRAQIAQQMAEALIAQGKTDVSSEELAQLVDAVVGMAEAKKREAEKKKILERVQEMAPPKIASEKPKLVKMSGTASALQMLQSAYDENDKKIEKDAPDAMDGLSDSDLETLLKNFNELSAEEQHSLIAYLKKLEARDPVRVERLRQYVSDAASDSPPAVEEKKEENLEPVVVESDEDDYTVDDVFKSATQKVKEDQIRQEMEIVKKSLEGTKSEPGEEPPATNSPLSDLSTKLSSATDLLALMQATIKSTPAPTPSPAAPTPNVVVSNTQPRSFGDLPEVPMDKPEPKMPLIGMTPAPVMPQQAIFPDEQSNPMHPPLNQMIFENRNMSSQNQMNFENRYMPMPSQNQMNFENRNLSSQNQMSFENPNMSSQNHMSFENRNMSPQNQMNYENRNISPKNQMNFDNRDMSPQDQMNFDNQNISLQNQMNFDSGDMTAQSQVNFENMDVPPPNHGNFESRNMPQQDQNIFGNRNIPTVNNQLNYEKHNNQKYDNRNMNEPPYNQGNNQVNNYIPPWARQNKMGNRGSMSHNQGLNSSFNPGPRGNFKGGRGQDNFNMCPPMNQQFGNQGNNFRGRGRGNFGGPPRGRGRGYY